VQSHGPFASWSAAPSDAGSATGSLQLLVGDFFAATPALIGPIDALYDRGALIALPAELRPRYVALLRALLPQGAPALVITLEYDQSAMSGPPFAVLESELRTLYAGAEVELVDQRPAPKDGGKCSQLGVPATERCFLIGGRNPRS
jgi:thiopurine S-methyltransferase